MRGAPTALGSGEKRKDSGQSKDRPLHNHLEAADFVEEVAAWAYELDAHRGFTDGVG